MIRALRCAHCYVLRVSDPNASHFIDRIRTFHHSEFSLDALVRGKRRLGLSVSVCIPAHNEENTVGLVVSTVERKLVVYHSLVDEVIVLDDRSKDRTAIVARAAGASVASVADVLPETLGPPGKGNVQWRSLHVSDGDIVCWVDADIAGFRAELVSGTLGPLLNVADIAFVKGFYARPTNGGDRGGGRVTELVAKPLIASLFPELVGVRQPLAGATLRGESCWSHCRSRPVGASSLPSSWMQLVSSGWTRSHKPTWVSCGIALNRSRSSNRRLQP